MESRLILIGSTAALVVLLYVIVSGQYTIPAPAAQAAAPIAAAIPEVPPSWP